jgi:predicted ATP-grasp superfamily ATP-dependent carboligase
LAVPAVIVGGDVNGLGVVRSLAREGVPTWLVDCNRADPSMGSRFPTKITVPSLSGSAAVDALVALRPRFATNPVLLLTQEETVKAVSASLDRIASLYRISMPNATVMQRLIDKIGFQLLAESHGFPIPRAVHLRQVDDLAASDALTYPCVLKPVVKTPDYAARFKKAYKVEDPAKLREIFLEIKGTAEMIAQEWIEGGDDRIYFCLQYRARDGNANVSFAGRKLRSWPLHTGGTASCVPAPEVEEELTRITDAFFTAVGFFGIGSMEFKRHISTGQFMMIEPTVGRTDFQEEIATLNSVNIPYAAYCAELGRDIPLSRPIGMPSAWSVSPIDRWASRMQANLGMRFPPGLRRYDALWRLDDPLPWCAETVRRLIARLSGLKHLGR